MLPRDGPRHVVIRNFFDFCRPRVGVNNTTNIHHLPDFLCRSIANPARQNKHTREDIRQTSREQKAAAANASGGETKRFRRGACSSLLALLCFRLGRCLFLFDTPHATTIATTLAASITTTGPSPRATTTARQRQHAAVTTRRLGKKEQQAG